MCIKCEIMLFTIVNPYEYMYAIVIELKKKSKMLKKILCLKRRKQIKSNTVTRIRCSICFLCLACTWQTIIFFLITQKLIISNNQTIQEKKKPMLIFMTKSHTIQFVLRN